jgi:hypothetical protein
VGDVENDPTRTDDGVVAQEPMARRHLLRAGGIAAAGAAVAAVASAVGADPAGAANGDNFVLGVYSNSTSAPTQLVYNSGSTLPPNFFGLGVADQNAPPGWADATPAIIGLANFGNFSTGVQGKGTNSASGVFASSDSGYALVASSDTGIGAAASGGTTGVVANGGSEGIQTSGGIAGIEAGATNAGGFGVMAYVAQPNGAGVFALKYGTGTGEALLATNLTTGYAILATDTDVTGIGFGSPGTPIGIAASLRNAANPSDAVVASTLGTGHGVNASSAKGVGLLAQTSLATNANPAVQAQSNGKGQAVLAANTAAATLPAVQATSAAAVPALQVTGKAVPAGGAVALAGNAAALTVQGVSTFTRSGVATIAAGATSIVVNVAGGLTATSHVLATLQTRFASGTQPQIQSVVPATGTGKITIYLSAAVPASHTVSVAWFVVG